MIKSKKRNTSLESIPLALDLSDAMRLHFAPPQAYKTYKLSEIIPQDEPNLLCS